MPVLHAPTCAILTGLRFKCLATNAPYELSVYCSLNLHSPSISDPAACEHPAINNIFSFFMLFLSIVLQFHHNLNKNCHYIFLQNISCLLVHLDSVNKSVRSKSSQPVSLTSFDLVSKNFDYINVLLIGMDDA